MPTRLGRCTTARRLHAASAASAATARRRAASAASAAARIGRDNTPSAGQVNALRGGRGRGGYARGAQRGGARAAAAPARALTARSRKRSRSVDGSVNDELCEDSDDSMDVDSEEDLNSNEGSVADGVQGLVGAGAHAAPRNARMRRRKPLPNEPHMLQPMRLCIYGCGAMVFPEEGTVCCSAGKRILGHVFNPPIDEAYLAFLQQEHVGADSRLLNSALAMATQGTFPSKAMGGVGFVHHHYGHLDLMGTVYLALRGLHGSSAFDTYLQGLPQEPVRADHV